MNKSNRELYDCYALPCDLEGYLPNARCKKLCQLYTDIANDPEKNDEVQLIFWVLRQSLVTLQSFPPCKSGGTETKTNEISLNAIFGEILHSLWREPPSSGTYKMSNNQLNFDCLLAGSGSKGEHLISHDTMPLIGSECKGTDASIFAGLPQCFQLCGDSAIEQLRLGLTLGDCVVPGLVLCGQHVQIICVYLLAHNFPVLVNMSRLLSLTSVLDVTALSRWIVALKLFAIETVNCRKQSMAAGPTYSKISLACDLYFVKPLKQFMFSSQGQGQVIAPRNDSSNLRLHANYIMHIYQKLSIINVAQNYILFPLGLISLPSTDNTHARHLRATLLHLLKKYFKELNCDSIIHAPIIVYDLLDTPWTVGKPDQIYVESYCQKVTEVVRILNEAGIAHMDLRPHNIMWRPASSADEGGSSKEVELRLIDFEDALIFGDIIVCIDKYLNDPRYPFFDRGHGARPYEHIKAGAYCNDWFLQAVIAWAYQEEHRFSKFMSVYHTNLVPARDAGMLENMREVRGNV